MHVNTVLVCNKGPNAGLSLNFAISILVSYITERRNNYGKFNEHIIAKIRLIGLVKFLLKYEQIKNYVWSCSKSISN